VTQSFNRVVNFNSRILRYILSPESFVLFSIAPVVREQCAPSSIHSDLAGESFPVCFVPEVHTNIHALPSDKVCHHWADIDCQ
jgi:hypothetical protein